jgi:hypothetical protein
MKLGKAKAILNPYDWLPGHGENSIELRTAKGDMIVTIPYDGVDGELKKEIIFQHCCWFQKSWFPGVQTDKFTSETDANYPLGSMVVYPNSEVSAAWNKHCNWPTNFQHYSIYFLAENFHIQAIAESWELHDA